MYEDIKTAALYVRYSSNNQTEQSIEGQTRVCTEFCQRHNITITQIYADRATSASKDIEKRVNFLQMIRDSEKHIFDAVIVYKLDRFSRSRYDMATYKFKLKKNGVQLISATENISQDPEGIILESVLEGMAEFYSAELAQKINRGLRESAYKHNVIGGRIPLGYKIINKKFVIDEKTAPIVQEAFELYAKGTSIAEISRIFNIKRYKTSRGSNFGRSSFVKMLRNEKYIGIYQFHDYKAEDVIPPIISKELWDRVQSRNDEGEKRQPGSYKTKQVYLLSGKIFCGHCGSHMNGDGKQQNTYAYYQCFGRNNCNKNCTKKGLRKEWIENIVVQDAMSLLTDGNIEIIADTAVKANEKELQLTTNIPQLKIKLAEINQSLENLTKAIETGSAPEILVKRIMSLENDKRNCEAELREEEKGITYLDKPKVIFWLENFRNGDVTDEVFMKQLIDTFVNSVTVWDEPGNNQKITIAYNLMQKEKTYHLSKNDTSNNFGFEIQNTWLEVKSEIHLILHTISIYKRFHDRSCFRKNNKCIQT